MDRRTFMRKTAGAAVLSTAYGVNLLNASDSPGIFSASVTGNHDSSRHLNLLTLPNFCAHEHWGSINSIGRAEGGYRSDYEAGAEPSRRTGIFDIVLEPYLTWFIAGAGTKVEDLAEDAGEKDMHSWWENRPKKALRAVKTYLERQLFTGTFQCTRRGIQELYGIDIASLNVDDWMRADRAISVSYSRIFAWYRKAMKKVCFTELIRPVQPEFYFSSQTEASAKAELDFTHTIMRVDPFLDFWRKDSPRRDRLADSVGIEPRDASTWRAFLDRIYDIAAERNTTGIKQLQAYSRHLDFPRRSDSEVVWSGELNEEQITVFKDWVMNECCKRAHERGWPHQVHVGTHNITESSPMPLQSLARRYPKMNIVMIHCWPFLDEAGWLAKQLPNVYIDTCWAPVLNPEYFRKAISGWINYVPVHKVMCSHDSTTVEMAAGSSLFTREILTEILMEQMNKLALDSSRTIRAASDMLHNNSVRIYGIGEEV